MRVICIRWSENAPKALRHLPSRHPVIDSRFKALSLSYHYTLFVPVGVINSRGIKALLRDAGPQPLWRNDCLQVGNQMLNTDTSVKTARQP